MDTTARAAFAAYYSARAPAMRATAYLLCGDWHQAEDYVQTAFTRLFLAWHRVSRREVLDRYTRKIVLNVYLADRRRAWSREVASSDLLGEIDVPAAPAESEQRLDVMVALAALPPRQRATVVLRHWEDLSCQAELLKM